MNPQPLRKNARRFVGWLAERFEDIGAAALDGLELIVGAVLYVTASVAAFSLLLLPVVLIVVLVTEIVR